MLRLVGELGILSRARHYVGGSERFDPVLSFLTTKFRVRKAPSTEVVEQPAKKAAGVTAAVEPVRAVKA